MRKRPLRTEEAAKECVQHLLDHRDLYKFASEVSDLSYRFGHSGTIRYMFLDFLEEELKRRCLSVL